MDFGVACSGSASLCSHTTKIKLVPLTLIAHTLAITVLWIPQVERTPTGSSIAGGSGKSVRSAQRTESAYLIFAVILPRRLQDVNGSFHCQWESLQSYQNSVSGIGMISMRFAQLPIGQGLYHHRPKWEDRRLPLQGLVGSGRLQVLSSCSW